MPVTYQIDVPNGLIHTKCSGALTLAEVIGHFRELERDPNCPAHLDVLLEVSDGTTVPQSEELRDVAREIGRVRSRVQFGACAIVASTDVLFGMMRVFEVFAQDYFRETQVFRTIGEATSWLVSVRQAQ